MSVAKVLKLLRERKIVETAPISAAHKEKLLGEIDAQINALSPDGGPQKPAAEAGSKAK